MPGGPQIAVRRLDQRAAAVQAPSVRCRHRLEVKVNAHSSSPSPSTQLRTAGEVDRQPATRATNPQGRLTDRSSCVSRYGPRATSVSLLEHWRSWAARRASPRSSRARERSAAAFPATRRSFERTSPTASSSRGAPSSGSCSRRPSASLRPSTSSRSHCSIVASATRRFREGHELPAGRSGRSALSGSASRITKTHGCIRRPTNLGA